MCKSLTPRRLAAKFYGLFFWRKFLLRKLHEEKMQFAHFALGAGKSCQQS
jgi:hypothetical protein